MSRKKFTDYEVLEKVFTGEFELDELTDHQREKHDRIRSVHALLMKFQSNSKIVKKMRTLYRISQSQVYRDIAMTEALYGSIRKSNKEYNRMRSEQMALETYRIALKDKDTRGMAAANRNFNEATGINIEDPDLPFERLETQPNIVVVPDNILALMAAKLAAGPVRWEEAKPQRLEDPEAFTEYEETDEDGITETD